MKHIDLEYKIAGSDDFNADDRAVIRKALEWIDEHPEQAPKIELTEHQLRNLGSKLFYRWSDLGVFTYHLQQELESIGVKTLEPTDEEKLADDIRQLDFEGALPAARLARELTKRGWGKVEW